jgi:hypothetical protein
LIEFPLFCPFKTLANSGIGEKKVLIPGVRPKSNSRL